MAIQTWKALVGAAFLAGSASAEHCARGEWDVIVVGKTELAPQRPAA
jgi:hypothetical protein